MFPQTPTYEQEIYKAFEEKRKAGLVMGEPNLPETIESRLIIDLKGFNHIWKTFDTFLEHQTVKFVKEFFAGYHHFYTPLGILNDFQMSQLEHFDFNLSPQDLEAFSEIIEQYYQTKELPILIQKIILSPKPQTEPTLMNKLLNQKPYVMGIAFYMDAPRLQAILVKGQQQILQDHFTAKPLLVAQDRIVL